MTGDATTNRGDEKPLATAVCEMPECLTVLTVGRGPLIQEDELAPFRAVHAANAEEALRVLAAGHVAVALFDRCTDLTEVLPSLNRSDAVSSGHPPPAIILVCDDSQPDALQSFVDAGNIFYLTRCEISTEQLRNLITWGSRHFGLIAKRGADRLSVHPKDAERLYDLCVRMPMQTDLASAGRLVCEIGCDVLQGNVVRCFVYDLTAGTLTPTDALENENWFYTAVSGLVGFVARTAEYVCLDDVGADPRYDSDTDAPIDMRSARFMAFPILGPAGVPAFVLTVLRTSEQEPFTVRDTRMMELLTECSAPALNQILVQNRVQPALATLAAGAQADPGIFRQEALDYYARNCDRPGGVLEVVPTWLRKAFWFVLVLFTSSVLGMGILLHALKYAFWTVK